MNHHDKIREYFEKQTGFKAITNYRGVYRASEEYTEWLENIFLINNLHKNLPTFEEVRDYLLKKEEHLPIDHIIQTYDAFKKLIKNIGE